MSSLRDLGGGKFEIDVGDPHYPSTLYDLDDPPKTLYVKGNLECLAQDAVSIIGARKATPYGIATAQLSAQIAVSRSVMVVSGGAIGCDTAAGQETLKQGGVTLAVLGCGADVIYPQSAHRYFQDIVDAKGALVSEQPWGTSAYRWTFPKRNRIIGALGKMCILTEAGLPSGTITTAEAALNLGRVLCAFPGSIFSPTSQGCNKLIEEGALAIWDRTALEVAFDAVYCTLDMNEGAREKRSLSIKDPLLRALISTPLRPIELSQELAIDIGEVLRLLGAYEIEGSVIRLRDGRYSATSKCLMIYGG